MMMIFRKLIFGISLVTEMAAKDDQDDLKKSLVNSGRNHYIPDISKKILIFTLQSLSDGQLSSLGVTPIGERHRLRLALRDADKQQGKMLEHLGYTVITGHFLHFECVR